MTKGERQPMPMLSDEEKMRLQSSIANDPDNPELSDDELSAMRPAGEVLAPALYAKLHVPPNRVNEIINGERSVTADTALRLGRYFGTTPEFWLNLQQAHDLSPAVGEHGYETVQARELAEA